jgi:hypothetical protein
MTGIDSTTRPTPNQETEQLKAEIRRLFLDYVHLRNVSVETLQDVRYAERNLTLEERIALEDKFQEERHAALAAKHAILVLTAPAGGAE